MNEQLTRWITADAKIAKLKEELAGLQTEMLQQEREAQDAAIAIRQEMQNNGLLEDLIEGEYINYKLYFTSRKYWW